jgi:hypothetical protein
MFGLFVNEDLVEVGISRDGILAVTNHQSGQVSARKGITQRPDGGSATEDIAHVVVPNDQNPLDPIRRKRGPFQGPTLVNSDVEHFLGYPGYHLHF